MKKLFLLGLSFTFLFSSCVSQKQYSELETKQKETQDLLNSATVKLNSCLSDAAAANALSNALKDQLADLRKTNDNLIQSNKDLTMLTSKGASNVEKTLESLKEKDLKISRLQDAVTKKDSVMLALVTSLKKEVGINDPDIEVNVEKGVVFISIADKLLFKSGSYNVTSRAKEVLAKVAKVVKSKPDFEAMVEGHTDSRSYQKGVLLDNWDLSVKRATAIVRILMKNSNIEGSRILAAGRSKYQPVINSKAPDARKKNRRTERQKERREKKR